MLYLFYNSFTNVCKRILYDYVLVNIPFRFIGFIRNSRFSKYFAANRKPQTANRKPQTANRKPLPYIAPAKKMAFINNLLVPYQNALKLVLSVNTSTSPLPRLWCTKGRVLFKASRLISLM